MLKLSIRHQWMTGTLLVLLLVATRGHHFATLQSLPGATWAVFFLAGVYLRPRWVFPGLLVVTWFLDFAALTWGDSSGFCLTRAYLFLWPAYGALWFAGHWYADRHQYSGRTLLPLAGALLLGAVVCELFSSGGFYFFSGRFEEPTLTEFGHRLVRYFPGYLQSLALYTGIAATLHLLFAWLNGTVHRITQPRSGT